MATDGAAGVRVNAVQQSTIPPYAYTVGLASPAGHELICAGALRYDVQQIASILLACAEEVRRNDAQVPRSVSVAGRGDFLLGDVHEEWVDALIPAQSRGPSAEAWIQVTPSRPRPTIDVPDLAAARSEDRDPAWRWLDHAWDVEAPRDSHLVTTLGVLTGQTPVTIFRWELDQWEALDRPAAEVEHSEARVAPLGLLKAMVDDWSPFLHLNVGEGLQLVRGQWRPA